MRAPAGWVAGPIVLALFAWITYFCSSLLIDAYRYPDVNGQQRNYKYSDAVSRYMGADPLCLAGCYVKPHIYCTSEVSVGPYTHQPLFSTMSLHVCPGMLMVICVTASRSEGIPVLPVVCA